jgi:hypothetical protein
MAVMTQLGGWTIGGVSPVYFYRNYHALTPTGAASWAIQKMGGSHIVVVNRALPPPPSCILVRSGGSQNPYPLTCPKPITGCGCPTTNRCPPPYKVQRMYTVY